MAAAASGKEGRIVPIFVLLHTAITYFAMFADPPK